MPQKLRFFFIFLLHHLFWRHIILLAPFRLMFLLSASFAFFSIGLLLKALLIKIACSPAPEAITSPRGFVAYPSHNLKGGIWDLEEPIYYGPDSCDWILQAPEGYALNITILHFDTSPRDKLQVRYT